MKHFGFERVAQSAWVKSGRDETIKNLRGVFPRLWRDNALVQASFTERQSWPLPRIVTRNGRACEPFTFPPTVPLKKRSADPAPLCMPADRSTIENSVAAPHISDPLLDSSNNKTNTDSETASSAPKEYFDPTRASIPRLFFDDSITIPIYFSGFVGNSAYLCCTLCEAQPCRSSGLYGLYCS